MAQRLVTQDTCDWHGALPSPVPVDATAKRTVSNTKEIDLCGFCALIWDMVFPRQEELLQMLRPEVIEVLMRSAHTTKEATTKNSATAQLALPAAEPVPTEEFTPPAAATEKRKKAVANRGRRNPKEAQVRCPLPHSGANSPDEYWVSVRDRGSHAKSSHKLLGPEIAYELPGDGSLALDVKCFRHRVCADAGGFGFKSAAGLNLHIRKADEEGWELAPGQDTTATLAQAVTVG